MMDLRTDQFLVVTDTTTQQQHHPRAPRPASRPGAALCAFPPFTTEQEAPLHPIRLLRCLNDTALPMEVRVAAALVRLYALPLTRIVELTDDHLHHDQGHTYLTVSHHPFVLPPKFARRIDHQLQRSPRRSNTAGRRYLLPGHSPGRPRNPLSLADTLRHHGLPARAARNTAMLDALVDLPPMVIADLLGIRPKTAERWATLAGGNWSE
ncbi:hypothetical protein [Streptomyces mirabilis]|uniref:hypothetical protein n=1 Tax=Streptomyces mirabilis TaxID=68239 RepID=UPI00331ADE36